MASGMLGRALSPPNSVVSLTFQVRSACLSSGSSLFLTFSTKEFPVPVQISEEEAVDKSGFSQARLSCQERGQRHQVRR